MSRNGLARKARRSVLISGAGISGPALAYWLHRSGCAVTVVEKAAAPRAGGYPVDVRGTATEVVRRMGILPRLRAAHIGALRCTFRDADGGTVATLSPHAFSGDAAGRDIEVRRGDLTELLYGLVRDDVEFLFHDSIRTLDQSGEKAEVTFRSGLRRTFDVVIGADGTHSHTRELVFGPEERFHRHLGHRFALFTLPNTFGLSRELLMWNAPGKTAALYAVGGPAGPAGPDGPDEVHAFLNVHDPQRQPSSTARNDPDAQRDLVARAFTREEFGEGAAGDIARLVDGMRHAPDLFCDTAGQIRMPRWSNGRVALVGDAAYAPSFLTGQGTSLALVGACLLGHALATCPEPATAFAAYESGLRKFVTMNQALAGNGATSLFPATRQALERRNARLRGLVTLPPAPAQPAHSALTLPPLTPRRRRERH